MSQHAILSKTLAVLSVSPSIETTTGDTMHQVVLGSYCEMSQEILNRLPPHARQTFVAAKEIGVNELIIYISLNLFQNSFC
jgi:hypothetical protein